ncbi:MAG TPA: group III truncated hemoglobin [Cytophagaceae bacterium]
MKESTNPITQKQLEGFDDVKLLVDSFYKKVNDDHVLSPVFNDFAKVDWDHHLPVMYSFWDSVLFGSMTYKGQPFPKHAALPITTQHFDHWVTLFIETVDEHFTGPKAEEVKQRAFLIAQTFQAKLGLL